MKKFFLLLAVAIFALPSLARDFEYNGLNYTILDEDARTCETKASTWSPMDGTMPGNSAEGDVIIPATVYDGDKEYSVTRIGYESFTGCQLTSVSLPATVTVISTRAFCDCDALTSVDMADSVTSIEWAVFANCTSLNSVKLSDTLTNLGNSAFSNCSSLTSIEIPSTITVIDESTFYYCSGLTSVTLPDLLTTIGNNAFYNCSSLEAIEFPETVTSIGSYAFYYCHSLAEVNIPSSVTVLGEALFGQCSNLTAINIDDANPAYASPDGVLCNKEVTELLCCPGGRTGDYKIPSSIVTIGASAFSGCSALTSVEIPTSVTTIGQSAFFSCSALTSVEIPSSVSALEPYTFNNCTSLRTVEISASVGVIGDGVFMNCSSLTAINVDGANAVYTSPDGVLCNKEVTELLCYPAGREGSYVIPASVSSIVKWAFYNCIGLTSIDFPTSVTAIASEAFSGCSSLKSLSLPQSLLSIGMMAFCRCSSLVSVTIPESVTKLEWRVFANCENLKEVHIPASIVYFDNGGGLGWPEAGIWEGCPAIERVYYSAQHPVEALSCMFDEQVYTNATLYVSEIALSECETVTPWCLFANREAYNFDSGVADITTYPAVEVYTLDGMKVGTSTDKLPAGVYVVRHGSEVRKIAVK